MPKMAVLEKGSNVDNKSKFKKSEKVDKQVLLVEQEIKLAKFLASNEQKNRDRALKTLQKWLGQRSKFKPFAEDDFSRIWKGLFYTMWMADKPLKQEETAETISQLVHFTDLDQSLLFFKAGLRIIQNEWFGIDQHRLDKFLMFVRRLLRQGMFVLKNHSFKKININKFNSALEETILTNNDNVPLGLLMHFIEIYMEELSKVSEGKIDSNLVTDLLTPFIRKLCRTKDGRIINCIKNFVFFYLMRQHNLGLEYQAKYEAWRARGFPGSIDSIQKVKIENYEIESEEEDDEENSPANGEKPLDPRAGRVDVELPQIKFKPKQIKEALMAVKFDETTNPKSREDIKRLASMFDKLANGVYPLGLKTMKPKKSKTPDVDTNITKAAKRLIKFENKIMGKSQKNKKRKHEDTDEAAIVKASKKQKTSHLKTVDLTVSKTSNKLKRKNSDVVEEKLDETKKLKPTSEVQMQKPNKTLQQKSKKELRSKKSAKSFVDADKIEFMFERNSGTWFVTKEEEEKNRNLAKRQKKGAGSSSTKRSPSREKTATPNSSPKTGMKPVQLFSTPKKQQQTSSLFEKPTEWDDELKEGEIDMFIPSKKYLAKTSTPNITSTILRGKSRTSLSVLSKTAEITTPNKTGSAKKVRINTKLNQSQELREHWTQVKRSPSIPFDCKKKPGKPLLKTPVIPTPVNPFYRLRSSV